MDSIASEIRNYLAAAFPDRAGEAKNLADETSLFDGGFLDSLSFLGLVEFIEEKFSVTVPPDDFVPERFSTLQQISSYIEGRRK